MHFDADKVVEGLESESGKLVVRLASEFVPRLLRRFSGKSLPQAQRNVDQFLVELGSSVGRAETEATAAPSKATALRLAEEDPDVAVTIASAIRGASRTPSAERHRMLANAVAERLRAAPGTSRAVVSTAAVEVLPRLANEHLDALGLLAMLYAVRPSWTPPPTPPFRQGLTNAQYDAEEQPGKTAAAEYAAWFEAECAFHESMATPNADTMLHLASAACVVSERSRKREFWRVVSPRVGGEDAYLLFPTQRADALTQVASRVEVGGRPLISLWDELLQFNEPTPTGTLVGLLVHDQKAGSRNAEAWEWSRQRPSSERWEEEIDKPPTPEEIAKLAVRELESQLSAERLRRGDTLIRGV